MFSNVLLFKSMQALLDSLVVAIAWLAEIVSVVIFVISVKNRKGFKLQRVLEPFVC
jgi:hypothetical protein